MSAGASITQVSRALRIVADAGLGHGELTDVLVNEIGSGELLLRASHSSVNYKDALAATGRGKVVRRFPLIGGIDVVGEVVESADPAYVPGDQAVVTGFGLSEEHDGGYAQWVRVPSAWAVRLPKGLTSWESMALGTGGLTPEPRTRDTSEECVEVRPRATFRSAGACENPAGALGSLVARSSSCALRRARRPGAACGFRRTCGRAGRTGSRRPLHALEWPGR